LELLGRLTFPVAMFAYPFYLTQRSPGKVGSHYDPACDLFTPNEGKLVRARFTAAHCFSVRLSA
jgi:acyl-lipid omega-3 desaturase